MSTTTFLKFIVVLLATFVLASAVETDYDVEDVYVPPDCDGIATIGDHLLLEYAVHFSNGTTGASLKKPSQLFHLVLDNKVEHCISFLILKNFSYFVCLG